MELLWFLLAIIGSILLISGISYGILFLYADRMARKNDPEPQTLLGVVSPKKED